MRVKVSWAITAVAISTVLMLMTGWVTGPASAASLGSPLVKFGSFGEDAGEIDVSSGGIAADPDNGHLFIVDGRNHRISEFTAWGEFVKAWGWGVDTGAAAPQTCTLASTCLKGTSGAGVGQLRDPNGIALSPSGDLYVFERENFRVQVFDQNGEFVRMFGGGVNQTDGTDICTKADTEAGDACGAGSTGTGPGEFFDGLDFESLGFYDYIDIAADGTVYVGDKDRIQKFGADGTFLAELALPEPALPGSLALDPVSGDIYFANKWGSSATVRAWRLDETTGVVVKPLTPGTPPLTPAAPLTGPRSFALDPEGFVYVNDDPDPDSNTGEKQNPLLRLLSSSDTLLESCCPSVTEGFGFVDLPFSTTNVVTAAGGADLYVAHYDFNLKGSTSFIEVRGPAPDKWPPPSVPPTIEDQFVTSVEQTSATLKGTINPNFWANSSYHVEYGLAPCSGGGCTTGTPELGLGTGIVKQPVSTQAIELSSLAPGTTYFYRFVAQSGGGGPVKGVEPGQQEGSFTTLKPEVDIPPCPNEAFRKGAGAGLRDCRAYEMVSPIDKLGGDILVIGNVNETPSRLNQAALDGNQVTYSSYRSFGDSDSAGYTNQYLATRGKSEWVSHGISPVREGPSAIKVRGLDSQHKAFTPDLSMGWLVHDTEPALAPGAIPGAQDLYRHELPDGGFETLTTTGPTGIEPDSYNVELQGVSADGSRGFFRANAKLTPNAAPTAVAVYQLYEAFGGGLKLVSVKTNGATATGSSTVGSLTSPLNNGREANSATAVSDDGRRVYWTESTGKVNLRLNGNQTKAVSAGAATFWAATPDGNLAIYEEAGALMLYDLSKEASEPLAPAGVQGVMGASTDLTRVYFISTSELVPGADPGGINLFLYEAGQPLRFIATMSDLDVDPGHPSPIEVSPRVRFSRVSADGQTALFMSRAALTGLDNRDLISGEPNAEVFLYEADVDQLLCVSCSPNGVRAAGESLRVNGHPSGYWVASTFPGAEFQLHAGRALSADGNRVYFNSFSRLLPADQSAAQDVYQWQALGSGACSAASDNYFAKNGGCISLISSGLDPERSEFVDASEDGRDVFFLTRASLVSWDPDQIDLYDAREGGGFAGPPPIDPGCEGEACQPQVSPPPPVGNSSQGFVGPANEPRLICPKKYVKRNNHCVKPKKGKKTSGRKKGSKRQHKARDAKADLGRNR